MKTSTVLVHSTLAQAPAASRPQLDNLWMLSSGGLLMLLLGLGVYSYLQTRHLLKQLKFESYKNQELQKKVKLALKTISKMEQNPDLIHSREFNLDYLRMRMDEEHFHTSIVNQLKVKVKQKISVALRPRQAEEGLIGVASKPRVVDEIFDVEYAPQDNPIAKKRVLFRIQIRLAKLPTQATSSTIGQLVECIENFMSPDAEETHWQPTIQGRIANMHWDQKAKPTPLLVIEQSSEGANVTLRSRNELPASMSSTSNVPKKKPA
ncbi:MULTISPECIES: hypothetical protein [Cyanophyceae]|uniref:hypothetical protein n=1 Tax=Cyanophyceae TaxID=3028117 RepID=UPI001685296E|nr:MULTISPECIES: hypothetical protein [Cyanophyceae]MBD1917925.1 hypothetical protein [Phormidium sp. FACHB-77]MBD2029173.1 hypothetical protein [Phormidium sp. FACHB-322]MBD2049705.1 hypothetical protein [Leptolyngbya sp. FACHB-60]